MFSSAFHKRLPLQCVCYSFLLSGFLRLIVLRYIYYMVLIRLQKYHFRPDKDKVLPSPQIH